MGKWGSFSSCQGRRPQQARNYIILCFVLSLHRPNRCGSLSYLVTGWFHGDCAESVGWWDAPQKYEERKDYLNHLERWCPDG